MTKDIMQIMERREEIKTQLAKMQKDYQTAFDNLKKEDQQLSRLESMFENEINIHYVQIAKRILNITGDVTANVDGRVLTEAAALDIAKGCPHLKKMFFGNKTYEGFYQSCDCQYGYGPRHGGIKDKIGLVDPSRELTE